MLNTYCTHWCSSGVNLTPSCFSCVKLVCLCVTHVWPNIPTPTGAELILLRWYMTWGRGNNILMRTFPHHEHECVCVRVCEFVCACMCDLLLTPVEVELICPALWRNWNMNWMCMGIFRAVGEEAIWKLVVFNGSQWSGVCGQFLGKTCITSAANLHEPILC